MITFQKLSLDDIPKIKQYFSFSNYNGYNKPSDRGCDNTIGGVFIWRDYFQTEYTVYSETLILKMKYLNGVTAFSVPLGNNVSFALIQIEDYCANERIPLVFCTVTKSDLLMLSEKYEYCSLSEKNWADYIYNAEDLSTFSGRKFNGQRNHINYFMKQYPDHSVLPISKDNISDVINFFNLYKIDNNSGTPIFLEEQRKVSEVLENYDLYSQSGCVIYVNGKVAAFSIGECIGDTLYVHIEKADVSYRGAYPMIVREFVRMYSDCNVKYVNREDDSGDEGLRTSKLSYHPIEIIEKFTVMVKNVPCNIHKRCSNINNKEKPEDEIKISL